jgi:hypothetical protein
MSESRSSRAAADAPGQRRSRFPDTPPSPLSPNNHTKVCCRERVPSCASARPCPRGHQVFGTHSLVVVCSHHDKRSPGTRNPLPEVDRVDARRQVLVQELIGVGALETGQPIDRPPALPRQQPTRRGQQRSMSCEPRTLNLAAQHRQLMSKHDDVEFLELVRARAEKHELQQAAQGEVAQRPEQQPFLGIRWTGRPTLRAIPSPQPRDRVNAPHTLGTTPRRHQGGALRPFEALNYARRARPGRIRK